jgi:AbrB family looped-hinge helix DNA binding protein
MGARVRMSANGRICIPADVRERLGLKDGDTLDLRADETGIHLTTLQQRVREVQAIYARLAEGKPPYTMDDFIRDRPAMWGETEDDPGQERGE